MNIWFFNHYAVPPSLYPLARTYNFAKYLLKNGHTISIFAASTVHNSDLNLITGAEKYRIETIDKIKYIYLKTKQYRGNGIARIINMVHYTLGLFKVTKKFRRPDVIIATSVHPLTCVAGIKIAKKYKCKCIIEIADLWPLTLIEFGILNQHSLLARALYRLEYWIYKNADSIIFTMEGGKDYIIDKGWDKDIDMSKIHHINNGIDLEVFDYNREKYVFEDEDLNDVQTFKVVYAGSIRLVNNVKSIIDAAQVINKKSADHIRFLIYGKGSDREYLERYCLDNKITNVKFKGFIDKKWIPSILSRSDLNIMHIEKSKIAKYGASLNKMFEYFASGKPTISDCECGYDLIKKYQCGIVIDGANAEQLAEAIISFNNMSYEEYDTYCKNSLIAAKDFDFRLLAEKLEKVILAD